MRKDPFRTRGLPHDRIRLHFPLYGKVYVRGNRMFYLLAPIFSKPAVGELDNSQQQAQASHRGDAMPPQAVALLRPITMCGGHRFPVHEPISAGLYAGNLICFAAIRNPRPPHKHYVRSTVVSVSSERYS